MFQSSNVRHKPSLHIVAATSSISQLQALATGIGTGPIQTLILVRSTVFSRYLIMVFQVTPGVAVDQATRSQGRSVLPQVVSKAPGVSLH